MSILYLFTRIPPGNASINLRGQTLTSDQAQVGEDTIFKKGADWQVVHMLEVDGSNTRPSDYLNEPSLDLFWQISKVESKTHPRRHPLHNHALDGDGTQVGQGQENHGKIWDGLEVEFRLVFPVRIAAKGNLEGDDEGRDVRVVLAEGDESPEGVGPQSVHRI